jgi:meiotically up-regulated gene 157 (Mug157) protein
MAITMQALTSTNDDEITELLQYLVAAGNSTGFMHESFWMNNASRYTRGWFAWANSYFGALILQLAKERPHLIFQFA